MRTRLVVGIPALNEAPSIGNVIRELPKPLDGIDEMIVLVIDDGSTDDTARLAREAGARVVSHHRRLGLGNAFQTMQREAIALGADILVTIDADGQFNPHDIPALIQPILANQANVCTASRFADTSKIPAMPAIKKWGNHRVARLVSQVSGRKFDDVSCGFRAYSREALLRLTVYGAFTYTHEALLDLAAKGVSIQEIPLHVRGVRQFGKSRMASNVFRYAAQTSSIIVRFYRDQQPLRVCLWLAIPLFIAGLELLALSVHELLVTGVWLKWAAFVGGGLWGVSLALIFFGFMADIASRQRRNQEEIIYWVRRAATDRSGSDAAGPGTGNTEAQREASA